MLFAKVHHLRGLGPCALREQGCDFTIASVPRTLYVACECVSVVVGVLFTLVVYAMQHEFGWRTFMRIGSDPRKVSPPSAPSSGYLRLPSPSLLPLESLTRPRPSSLGSGWCSSACAASRLSAR